MDVVKVVDWVKNNRIEHLVQNNDPTGQAKLRKVCRVGILLAGLIMTEPMCFFQDYYEHGNGNFPGTMTLDGKQVVGKIHVAR